MTGAVRRRTPITITALAVALVAAALVSAALGQLDIPVDQILGSLATHANSLLAGTPVRLPVLDRPASPLIDATLWAIRFPRVALAIVVGAALAVGGLVMQGTFRNPLADPSVVGVYLI